MLALAVEPESPPKQSGNPNIAATSAKAVEVRQAVRQTLAQALELKELAYDAARAIKPKVNALAQANEAQAMDSQEARAVAQSVTALCKAFADMVTIIRIERGKPLPGSLRPESKPKKSKAKLHTFSESKPE